MRRAGLIAVAIATVAVVAPACSSSKNASKVDSSTTTSPVPTPPGTPVAVVATEPSQTISAFGASGAWWPIDLVRFPKRVQQFVADELFTARGIALSGYRYNIGGGGVGVTTPSRAPHQVPQDVAGLTFLRDARAAQVPVLTGFVNSAPPQFTTNGKSCGGQLRVGAEPAFAQYLAGTVRYVRSHGATLDYVSPMNEPDNSFADCGQEGMAVPIAQRAPLVNALGQSLGREAPYARVIADETTADVILASEAPQWAGAAKQNLFAIAHHTYDFPNDALRGLLPPLAKQLGKPTWMTEICCYKGSGGVGTSMGANYDPTITQGLWLADQIYDDFTIAGDSAWYWWTALSSVIGCDPHADPSCATRVNVKGFNDGLLYYDPNYATNGDTQIFTTKRFYALGQFSRYVRPGAVLHRVSGLPAGVRALAFSHGADFTVVAWNDAAASSQFALTVPGNASDARDAVATSPTLDLAPTAHPVRTTAGSWLVSLPARTIATYTFGQP
jgi:O-glycosyl hydrolase